MGALTTLAIKDSYKSLLKINDETNGVGSSLLAIEDGEGTDTALQLSDRALLVKPGADTAATFAAQSAYVFPRPTDPTKHITNNSYRKKLYKFNYKFGLAERSLVRSFGSRKLYTYKNIYSFKHLRKTFATHYGAKYGLQETSERMRHSSTKVTKDHYYNQRDEKFKGRSAYDIPDNVVQLKEGSNND